MHEFFLTTTIRDVDLKQACAVLQGLCWMSARHNVYRITYYAGAPRPKGLPNVKSLPVSRHTPLWNELHKELSRSSYVFQLVHEVFVDKDFGTGPMDMNNMAGTLRWTGFPDPPREKGQLATHRKKIDIPDQKRLLAIMASNGQAYKAQLVEETYTFIRDNIEFTLSRNFHLEASSDEPGPSSSLPQWSDLDPVDPAKKWILRVKRDVLEDNQPEKMKQAQKELSDIRAELEPLFTFVPIDRKVLDTRIAPPPIIPGQHP